MNIPYLDFFCDTAIFYRFFRWMDTPMDFNTPHSTPGKYMCTNKCVMCFIRPALRSLRFFGTNEINGHSNPD